jgi:hypothetical protein
MLQKWFDSIVEGAGASEVVFALLFGLAGYFLSIAFDIHIPNRAALYGTFVTISIGLMTVSAIVVNLAGAIIPATIRIQQAIDRIALASFVGLAALLGSAAVGVVLLAAEDLLGRAGRYAAAGVWLGLVFAASVRSLVLGKRILVANLRSKVAM